MFYKSGDYIREPWYKSYFSKSHIAFCTLMDTPTLVQSSLLLLKLQVSGMILAIHIIAISQYVAGMYNDQVVVLGSLH